MSSESQGFHKSFEVFLNVSLDLLRIQGRSRKTQHSRHIVQALMIPLMKHPLNIIQQKYNATTAGTTKTITFRTSCLLYRRIFRSTDIHNSATL
ncbi:hypothetical protein QL285_076030 [Trifolium repens]|nr:hypothetical protein QL285_076029 [Trifolium repens]KAK2375119.1 hypothetical protein QL285_076030 [Trifolium repens]